MMPIGSIVGALWSWYLVKTMAPRWALAYVCFIWTFGCVLQVALPFNSMLYIARFIAGVGAGAISAIVPVYLAEIAPWKIRGRIIGIYQLGIAWGISAQYLIQYAAVRLSRSNKDYSDREDFALRLSFGMQLVPGIVLLSCLVLLPESPRLYAIYGLWGSAIGMIADIHAKGDLSHPEVLAQYREIDEEIRIERERGSPSFRMLLRKPLVKRLILGMSIQAWSQLCGVNLMMYHVLYILAGSGAASPFVMATIQYLLNYICTVPAIYLVDKVGRRRALLAGSFVMMICLFVTGVLQHDYGQPNVGESTKAPAYLSWIIDRNQRVISAILSLSCIFVAAFAMTWGPISWIYPAEIFPTEIRPRAVALCTAARWCCHVTVALSVPHLLWAINYNAYFLFGIFNGFALLHIYYAAYETKGYTLEEMHEVFDSKLPPWEFRPEESRVEALASRIRQQQRELQRANGRNRTGTEAIAAEEETWPFRRRPSS
ncbi:sugar transporter domain-containing protein [Trichoderma evansii]